MTTLLTDCLPTYLPDTLEKQLYDISKNRGRGRERKKIDRSTVNQEIKNISSGDHYNRFSSLSEPNGSLSPRIYPKTQPNGSLRERDAVLTIDKDRFLQGQVYSESERLEVGSAEGNLHISIPNLLGNQHFVETALSTTPVAPVAQELQQLGLTEGHTPVTSNGNGGSDRPRHPALVSDSAQKSGSRSTVGRSKSRNRSSCSQRVAHSPQPVSLAVSVSLDDFPELRATRPK